MSESLKIRDVGEGDINDISRLAECNDLLLDGLTPEIFGRSLRWLHENSPSDKRVQLLAECSVGVIAHYGGVPFRFKYYEDQISAVLASNLVVDKSYRKQSPFFPLQKEFIKTYQARGYSFAYGAITREGVLNPHLRMGWKALGCLRVYIRPISLSSTFTKLINAPIISVLTKFPLMLMQLFWDSIFFFYRKTLHVEEVISFDDSISSLLKDWMKQKSICSERSIDSLNWRFSEFKDRDYRIFIVREDRNPTGYLVARLMPMKQFSCVTIVDLVVLEGDKKSFNALMKKCISFARGHNVDLVVSALTDHDVLKSYFYSTGFFRSQEKFTIVGHFPKKEFLKFTNFKFTDFHINWFDHDYV